MENRLCVYFKNDEDIKSKIKKALKSYYDIRESELEEIESGFEFLFESETNGYAKIIFSNEDKIEIFSDFAYEAVEIYRMVENCVRPNDEEV